MQNPIENSFWHVVFISDDPGMHLLYPELLEELSDETATENHLSLLYLSDTNSYTFEEQIKVLTTRFPSRLISYFRSLPKQEYLELILNTNTKKYLKFCLSLSEEWQEIIVSQLRFLGIKPTQISFTDR